MTLLYTEGFDQYDVDDDLQIRGTHEPGSRGFFHATEGRFGGGCLKRKGNAFARSEFTLDGLFDMREATGTPGHFAFWFKADQIPGSTRTLWAFRDNGGNTTGEGLLGSQGQIALRPWNNAPVHIYSANDVILAGAWHHIEGSILVDGGASGRSKIWVDGLLIIDFTGDNLNAGPPDEVDEFWLYASESASQFYTFDDLVVWNELSSGGFDYTQLGAHRIETLAPDGDNAVEFTPTGAGSTNADRVSEAGFHDEDTTYVESDTVGHIDRYDIEDQAAAPTTCHGVAVHSRAKKTDTGAVTLRNILKHGTTEVEGQDHALTQDVVTHRADYYGDNPDTAAAWGNTDIDGVEAGVKYEA